MLIPLAPSVPGDTPQWHKLAAWVRERMPVNDVDGVWVFRVLRHDQKEFGTAILSRVDGERRHILTATYTAQIKGKQRGGFETQLQAVGSGPVEALQELLALVPVRADDEEPPVPVEVALWFPPDAHELPLDDA